MGGHTAHIHKMLVCFLALFPWAAGCALQVLLEQDSASLPLLALSYLLTPRASGESVVMTLQLAYRSLVVAVQQGPSQLCSSGLHWVGAGGWPGFGAFPLWQCCCATATCAAVFAGRSSLCTFERQAAGEGWQRGTLPWWRAFCMPLPLTGTGHGL